MKYFVENLLLAYKVNVTKYKEMKKWLFFLIIVYKSQRVWFLFSKIQLDTADNLILCMNSTFLLTL